MLSPGQKGSLPDETCATNEQANHQPTAKASEQRPDLIPTQPWPPQENLRVNVSPVVPATQLQPSLKSPNQAVVMATPSPSRQALRELFPKVKRRRRAIARTLDLPSHVVDDKPGFVGQALNSSAAESTVENPELRSVILQDVVVDAVQAQYHPVEHDKRYPDFHSASKIYAVFEKAGLNADPLKERPIGLEEYRSSLLAFDRDAAPVQRVPAVARISTDALQQEIHCASNLRSVVAASTTTSAVRTKSPLDYCGFPPVAQKRTLQQMEQSRVEDDVRAANSRATASSAYASTSDSATHSRQLPAGPTAMLEDQPVHRAHAGLSSAVPVVATLSVVSAIPPVPAILSSAVVPRQIQAVAQAPNANAFILRARASFNQLIVRNPVDYFKSTSRTNIHVLNVASCLRTGEPSPFFSILASMSLTSKVKSVLVGSKVIDGLVLFPSDKVYAIKRIEKNKLANANYAHLISTAQQVRTLMSATILPTALPEFAIALEVDQVQNVKPHLVVLGRALNYVSNAAQSAPLFVFFTATGQYSAFCTAQDALTKAVEQASMNQLERYFPASAAVAGLAQPQQRVSAPQLPQGAAAATLFSQRIPSSQPALPQGQSQPMRTVKSDHEIMMQIDQVAEEIEALNVAYVDKTQAALVALEHFIIAKQSGQHLCINLDDIATIKTSLKDIIAHHQDCEARLTRFSAFRLPALKPKSMSPAAKQFYDALVAPVATLHANVKDKITAYTQYGEQLHFATSQSVGMRLLTCVQAELRAQHYQPAPQPSVRALSVCQ